MTSVTRGNGQLIYTLFGQGPKKLLAFHGFGQDKTIFREWAEKVGSTYTIYAFDLFYHGESERTPGDLTKKEWALWMEQFIAQEKLDSFSVLGFSLGGRFAISTTLSFWPRVEELFLIAPDGVFLTPWFKLATTPVLRKAFKYFMHHPDKMEKVLRFNEQSDLFNPYLTDFVRKEMGNVENGRRIYLSWNHFKWLGYSKRQLIKRFNKGTYTKVLILGDKDHVIHPKKILPIIDQMKGFKVHQLPMKHHQLVKPEVAELLLDDQ